MRKFVFKLAQDKCELFIPQVKNLGQNGKNIRRPDPENVRAINNMPTAVKYFYITVIFFKECLLLYSLYTENL